MVRNDVPEAELVMRAAAIMIYESALYQSILLDDGAAASCHRIVNSLIQNNMKADIHPIIMGKAERLLKPIKPDGPLTDTERWLSLVVL